MKHVTDINPRNVYNTPTGMYCYPLYSYFDKTDLTNETKEERFREKFPYKSDERYVFFYILKNNENILTNDTDKNTTTKYVKKIENIYGHIKPVSNLCESFYNGEFRSQYSEFKNEVHRFWLFAYDVIPYIMSKDKNKQTAVTNLYNKIGVKGFVDYKGDGYIHPSEPRQAVFFKVKNNFNLYVYEKQNEDFSKLPIDKINYKNLKYKMHKYDPFILMKYKPEFIGVLKNKIKDLNGTEIQQLLIRYPDRIKDFKPYINKIDDYYLTQLLIHEPDLIIYFKDSMVDIHSTYLTKILIRQPHLINYIKDIHNSEYQILDAMVSTLKYEANNIYYFKNDLPDFSNSQVYEILKNQPSLIYNFRERIKELHINYIIAILYNTPHIVNFFKNRLSEINDDSKQMLINSHPQLEKEFENKEDLNESKFEFNTLSDDDRGKIYDVFKTSYEKSTGNVWDQNKFENRAKNWLFFGDENGYITVRKQNSGLYKLTGVAGELKGISSGLNELNSLNIPIWGVMTEKIANIMVKKYNFIKPPTFIMKTLLKRIPNNVFGGADFSINKDGSLNINYSDVGETTKYFIGNKNYFKFLVENILPQMKNISPNIIYLIKKMF